MDCHPQRNAVPERLLSQTISNCSIYDTPWLVACPWIQKDPFWWHDNSRTANLARGTFRGINTEVFRSVGILNTQLCAYHRSAMNPFPVRTSCRLSQGVSFHILIVLRLVQEYFSGHRMGMLNMPLFNLPAVFQMYVSGIILSLRDFIWYQQGTQILILQLEGRDAIATLPWMLSHICLLSSRG